MAMMNKGQANINNQGYKYLQLIEFADLGNWSLYSLSAQNFSYNKIHTLTKIGSFLTRIKNSIKIIDNIVYKRPTIQMNGKGINLRDEVIGKSIGTKNQFLVRKAQFLLSKIDARNGAFGVVPEDLDQCIITGNFWTFDVDYSVLDPFYLSLLARTKKFQNLCQNASVGTTNRNYLQQNLFLNFQIPLPLLEKQKELVAIYNQKNLEAETKEQKANQLEKSIDEYFIEELGIELPEVAQNQDGFLKFIEFRDLGRWDIFAENIGTRIIKKSKYPLTRLKDTYLFPNRGWNKKQHNSKTFNYIEMGGIDPLMGIVDFKEINVLEAPSRATQIIKNGDLIIGKTRPYLKKFAIADISFEGFIASSAFSIIENSKSYNLLFLKEFLTSPLGVEILKNDMTGGLYPAITEDSLRKIQIPLPPLEVQNQIVDKISSIKEEIKILRSEAETLKIKAKEEFEKEVFN